MEGTVPAPVHVSLEAAWSAESFALADLSDLGTALDASYPFPLTFSDSTSPAISCADPLFDPAGYLGQVNLRPRYESLDGGRPNDFDLLPLTRTRSLTNDAKENAKEVSQDFLSRPLRCHMLDRLEFESICGCAWRSR